MIIRRTLGLGVAAVTAGLLGSAAIAQEVTLKLHQFLPPQATVPSQILDVWIESVEEASDGRIEIQHFPAMQLGGAPPQLMDQAIDGVADIVRTVVGYTPARIPRTEVFEMTFMMTDARRGWGDARVHAGSVDHGIPVIGRDRRHNHPVGGDNRPQGIGTRRQPHGV